MPKSDFKAGRELRLHGARVCNGCGEKKRAERFYASNPYRCKPCVRNDMREHRKDHPELWTSYGRRHILKHRYGITPEQYNELIAEQDGKCAICEAPHVRRRGINNFAIDHDHATGHIRGLLCHNCNRGLGHFQDSQALLLRAIHYVTRRRINAKVS